MKNFLIILLILLGGQAVGQVLPSTKCGIFFDYDNAGNQVKRYYDCKTIDPTQGPEDPLPLRKAQPGRNDSATAPLRVIQVYPNPASDYFIIRLQEADPTTHFHLYDAKGSIIAAGNLKDAEQRCNVSGISPGLYHLYILYKGQQYSFKLSFL
ncbi:T9SS type A sorting domain-containing protein [Chitinophagaceae bacterium MMS25-I14]